ncbi:MAG: hypothetical protein CMP35_00660 [Rickettsiales bacterium]|nr:hypothetical protein [Rickettsiales bacterium]
MKEKELRKESVVNRWHFHNNDDLMTSQLFLIKRLGYLSLFSLMISFWSSMICFSKDIPTIKFNTLTTIFVVTQL